MNDTVLQEPSLPETAPITPIAEFVETQTQPTGISTIVEDKPLSYEQLMPHPAINLY